MKRKKVGTSKKFTAVLTKEGKWYAPLIDLGSQLLASLLPIVTKIQPPILTVLRSQAQPEPQCDEGNN